MSQLRKAAERLKVLTELMLNLLQQLGALCSEQTRKSTVISGIPAKATYPLQSRTVAQRLTVSTMLPTRSGDLQRTKWHRMQHI